MEKEFNNEINDMTGKYDRQMMQKENQMDTLDSNLEVLGKFKDTKAVREDNLVKESRRYETLKRELEMLKRNGKLEMEQARKRLMDKQQKTLEDQAAKAQSDAEKNISEIERNI